MFESSHPWRSPLVGFRAGHQAKGSQGQDVSQGIEGQESHLGRLLVLPTQTKLPFFPDNRHPGFRLRNFVISPYGQMRLTHPIPRQTPRDECDPHFGPTEKDLELLRKGCFLSSEVTKLRIFWGPPEGEMSLKKYSQHGGEMERGQAWVAACNSQTQPCLKEEALLDFPVTGFNSFLFIWFKPGSAGFCSLMMEWP